jgi:tetratricopeptide (TPR) repeat protein
MTRHEPKCRSNRAIPLLGAWLVACFAGAAGCGGQSAEPKGPTQAAAQPTGATGTTPSGQQYAVSDLPSSGEKADRPKQNAAAATAYAAGLEAFRQGDMDGAQAQFAKAAEADPKAAYQAYHSLGVVRERLGNGGGALSAYLKAVDVVPDYEPSIVSYALLSARMGKTAEAEAYLKGKQAKMPKSAAVLAALAEVKSIGGDSGEAQRLAQEALKKNPDFRPAMETLARDHYRNRRLDLALYALKGILDGYGQDNPARDKDNAQAHLLRGLIYKEQGLRSSAIAEFKRALDLRPDLVEARVQLAAYLLESGNATEAAPLLEGALRYDRSNVYAHLNLGDAYRLLGKTKEARRELEWVLSKDPNVAEAHYDLGLLYLFAESIPGLTPQQSVDEALREFASYKEKKPRSAQGGTPDDTEELITRAKSKKAVMEAEANKPPPPVAPTPSAAPSAGPSMAAAATSAGAKAASGPSAAPAGSGAPASSAGSRGSLPPLKEGTAK